MTLSKHLAHGLESSVIYSLYGIFRGLPLDAASALGGFLGRAIGLRIKRSEIARANLKIALSDITPEECSILLGEMWDNLGRTVAELAHLRRQALFDRISYEGLHNMPAPGQAALFISGHIGNWELLLGVAHEHGVPITAIYRHMNNPHADKLLRRLRENHVTQLFPKGQMGAVKLGKAIKSGKSIAMLIDQRMNGGIRVPFFGKPAMTAHAVAQLALRYNMPIIPARIIRTKGCHFRAIVYPPLSITASGNEAQDIKNIMSNINRLFEGWIREYPAQWFWIHKRWRAQDLAEDSVPSPPHHPSAPIV